MTRKADKLKRSELARDNAAEPKATTNPKASEHRAQMAVAASSNGASLGFEARLFETANGLRGNVDPAEYKHIVLGLVFLKYISDMFEEHRAKLQATPNADPEDRDEYTAENVFWVPTGARWPSIQAKAKAPDIGQRIDNAMAAIEKENSDKLRGVLPKEYANPKLDAARLGKLIDVVSTVGFRLRLLAVAGSWGAISHSLKCLPDSSRRCRLQLR
jgi:type I restriction enzyme M protein